MRRDLRPRRGAPRGGARDARPAGACSRTRAWCGARRRARRCGRGSRPTARGRPPRRARCRAPRSRRSRSRRGPRSTISQARSSPTPTSMRAVVSIGMLGRGEPDAERARLRERLEPLEGEREVSAALVAGERVDLVHDHRAHAPQPLAAALGGEQQEERLRRGDQHVRRAAQHRRARGAGGVAAAQQHADLGQRLASRGGERAHLGERDGEVLLDVGGERLERRDVDDVGEVVRARRPGPRPRAAADRCRPGMRRASCPSRWAPRSTCRARARWRASLGPGAQSARRGSAARTRPAASDGRRRAGRRRGRSSRR